jgi:CysZ protein
MTVLGKFTQGLGSFFRGFGLLLRTPGLWPYSITPFLIGMGLLIWGLVWAFSHLGVLVEAALLTLASLSGLYFSVLYWLALILVWPAFVLALFFFVFLISKVIASPFNALLAERALLQLGHIEDRPCRLGPWLRVSARMLVVSFVKAVVFAVLGIVLLLLSFVPVLNVAAAFGFLLIVAFDSADYSFEALQMGFRARIRYFFAHFAEFSGFATSLGLVFFIPGFNFFLFPAAVAGGSNLISRISSR